jgi:hypothetical protein
VKLMTKPMTKGEREDLIRLVKQREKVAKTAAEQRSATMLAEFEAQVSALHKFNDDEVWNAATAAAIEAARKVNEEIASKATELGIPKDFQPKLTFSWEKRGKAEYNARRDDLRRLAKAEIDAMEKVARVQIESQSVNAQTEIIANGLGSEDAIAFLQRLPPLESMMPALDITTIQNKLAERARKSGSYLHLIE